MRTSGRATIIAAVMMAAISGCHKDGEGHEAKASLPAKGDSATLPAATQAPATPTTNGEPQAIAPAAEPPAAEPPAATVAPAAPAPSPGGEVQTRLTGQVTTQRKSQVPFKVQGFVASVVAKAGSVVKKGDVMATLDASDFELRVQLAKARRDQAKVGAESAKKELDREMQLKKENASTSSVLDKVQAAFDQARLAQKLAELDLTLAERAMDDTKLKAPYDGVVFSQIRFEGEYVKSGDPGFEIWDLASPEITFDAPERLMGKINIGDKLKVTIPSSGFAGSAEIVRTVPVITEKTRTFRVITRFSGSGSAVVPGSFAEATLN